MFVTFVCPRCEKRLASADLVAEGVLTCPECDWKQPLASGSIDAGLVPTECLRCGNADLWRQKNFPQWLGLTCVAVGAVSSSIAWGYHRPLLAIGILLGFALLDMVLYLTMPDVLVCYRCQTKHHQAEGDLSRHAGFNHELAERYRQERIRQRQAVRNEHQLIPRLEPDDQ